MRVQSACYWDAVLMLARTSRGPSTVSPGSVRPASPGSVRVCWTTAPRFTSTHPTPPHTTPPRHTNQAPLLRPTQLMQTLTSTRAYKPPSHYRAVALSTLVSYWPSDYQFEVGACMHGWVGGVGDLKGVGGRTVRESHSTTDSSFGRRLSLSLSFLKSSTPPPTHTPKTKAHKTSTVNGHRK